MTSFLDFPRDRGKLLLLLFIVTGLIFSDFGQRSQLAAQAPIIKNIQTKPPGKTGISNRDMEEICTAAVSALFNRPAAAIQVDGVEKGSMLLSSTEPAGSAPMLVRCRIEGTRIIWATRDGAWRTAASDEQVIFRLSPDEIQLTVSYPDGSEKQFRFPR